MKKQFFLILLLCFFSNVFAEPVQQIIFFGDSLTDDGNLYEASYKIMPKSPPYYLGRFSNGPVWAEKVSEYLQNKYQIQSENFAVGGATVIFRRPREGALPYYLKKEINSYLSHSSYPDRLQTLFFFWIGGNDYMDEKKESPEELVNNVVNEIVLQIRNVITNGGKRFVILDLPDFSKTPFAQSLDSSMRERLRKLSELNHTSLKVAVNQLKLEYPDFKFILIDIYSLFNDMSENIDFYNTKYGTHVVNLTESCWNGGYTLKEQKLRDRLAIDFGTPSEREAILQSQSLLEAYKVGHFSAFDATPCANPDGYLFWDKVHPTAVSHQIIGDIIIETLESASAFL